MSDTIRLVLFIVGWSVVWAVFAAALAFAIGQFFFWLEGRSVAGGHAKSGPEEKG